MREGTGERESDRQRDAVSTVVSLGRRWLTGKLACKANGSKSGQAFVGTLLHRQTGSLLTQPLPLSIHFSVLVFAPRNKHHPTLALTHLLAY